MIVQMLQLWAVGVVREGAGDMLASPRGEIVRQGAQIDDPAVGTS